jgi:hypothetical protein
MSGADGRADAETKKLIEAQRNLIFMRSHRYNL